MPSEYNKKQDEVFLASSVLQSRLRVSREKPEETLDLKKRDED